MLERFESLRGFVTGRPPGPARLMSRGRGFAAPGSSLYGGEMSNQDDAPNFKVTDKRLFDEEGEIRGNRVEERESPSQDAAPEAHPNAGRGGQADGSAQGIDFSSFVISLATTAMVHLGEGPVDSGAPPQDLDAAGQMIDILGMLKEKTEGNLSPDESRLVHDILYELRMKFLARRKAVKL